MNMNRVLKICLTAAVLLAVSFLSEAAYLSYVPQDLYQPDGTKLELFASGDEFHNWLHDSDGFTIMRDPATGMLVYAEKCGDLICPSEHVAGKADPSALGLTKWLNISPEEYQKKRKQAECYTKAVSKAPNTGSINNIVIFIRFADQEEFDKEISYYEAIFNPGSPVSMYSYFMEVSYNQLSVISYFYPISQGSTVVSYQDSRDRGYYSPYDPAANPDGYRYDWERGLREQGLLKDAIDAVGFQIPGDLMVDGDGDGYVDNVCFIVRGYPDGWNELLWPHKGSLLLYFAYINGKRVITYNLNMESRTTSAKTISHEMFHSLGAPDLYHYNGGFASVGSWDIMDMNGNPPQHMGAYMKYRYGNWIDEIPRITFSGTYYVNPITDPENNCYMIKTPLSDTEYFVVEHRRDEGPFEISIPGTGLLVYRINTELDGEGNADGPPDEVYIFRPDGTIDQAGDIFSAHYHNEPGRTCINDYTNPYSFFSDGSAGGLEIDKIEEYNGTMKFIVTVKHPNIKTDPAGSIGADSAVLKGTANPKGYDSSVYFEWGTTKDYGNITSPQGIGAGSSDISFESSVTGLTLGVTYHYRAVITSSYGAVYGSDCSFETYLCSQPEVTTYPAEDISQESALLQGAGNPKGCNAEVWFEWGEGPEYQNQTAAESIGNGMDDIAFSSVLTGLEPYSDYHYRAVISSDWGIVHGEDYSFTTSAPGDRAVVSSMENAGSIDLWEFDSGFSADRLFEGSYADLITAGDITNNGDNEILAYFSGFGVYYYDFTDWKAIIDIPVDDMAIAHTSDGNILILSVPGYGLYSWKNSGNSGTWDRIISVAPFILEVFDRDDDGYDELFTAFTDYGSYVYDFDTSSFSKLLSLCPESAVPVSSDLSYGSIAADFYPYGIYILGQDNSWEPLLNIGNDDGYALSKGDLEGDIRDELLGCFYQTIYMYSFQDNAWKELFNHPYDIIVPGRFAQEQKDDLILYSSIERKLMLYRSSGQVLDTVLTDADIKEVCRFPAEY